MTALVPCACRPAHAPHDEAMGLLARRWEQSKGGRGQVVWGRRQEPWARRSCPNNLSIWAYAVTIYVFRRHMCYRSTGYMPG
jgi:hypothetical protein